MMFWKHKDPEFGSEMGTDLGLEGPKLGLRQEADLGLGLEQTPLPETISPGVPPPMRETPAAAPQSFGQAQAPQPEYNKDLEIVSAKLDALKASLDSMNQRLANLEHIARESREQY